MTSPIRNIISELPDQTAAILWIEDSAGREIRLTIDYGHATIVRGRHWLWDRKFLKAFTYFDGKKIYLASFIAEMTIGAGTRVKQVRFLNGPYDFRLKSLKIFYGEKVVHAEQSHDDTTSPGTLRNLFSPPNSH